MDLFAVCYKGLLIPELPCWKWLLPQDLSEDDGQYTAEAALISAVAHGLYDQYVFSLSLPSLKTQGAQ